MCDVSIVFPIFGSSNDISGYHQFNQSWVTFDFRVDEYEGAGPSGGD